MKKLLFRILVIFLTLISLSDAYAQYNEGDTVQFWSVSYVDWPPLWGQPQRVVNAICRKAGAHCYVFVEDQAPAANYAALTALVNEFDTHYYPDLTAKYGPVPDEFDQDSAVFILALNENNWAGYFDPGQQMSDSLVMAKWNRHSSEREIIYVAANYINYSQSTVAHEFGHLLHWGGDHSPEPIVNPTKYWEEAWVDEGFSTFAAMYLTEDIYQQNVQQSAYFSTEPDIPLIWFSNYNQVQLFMLFMYEHFGNWDYISTLISEQLNGINGVANTLAVLGYPQGFDDAFEQFAVANYIDDPTIANGKYAYSHYNFTDCHLSANHSAIPTGTKNGTTSAYAADYIAFNSNTPKPITIDFNGDDSGKFRLAFILMNTATDSVFAVIPVQPDAFNNAQFQTDSLGILFNRIVMVVMNVDSTVHEGESSPYVYSASLLTGINKYDPAVSFQIYPNPAEDFIYLDSDDIDLSESEVEITNFFGQSVMKVSLTGQNNRIDVTGLTAGAYLLGFSLELSVYRRMFVKK